MLAMRLTAFEHLVDIGRVDELRGHRTPERRPVGSARAPPRRRSSVSAEVAGDRPAARSGHAVHRPLPDPQPRHPRRLPRPRRPRRRVPGGGARPRRPTSRRCRPGARERSRPSDFFTGCGAPRWRPTSCSSGVTFPVWTGRCGFAIEEFARRHGDFAMAGAVGRGRTRRRRPGRGVCASVCSGSALGVRTGHRGRGRGDGHAERRRSTPPEVGRLAMSGLTDVPSDVHGSADYRGGVGATMVARAWTAAIEGGTRWLRWRLEVEVERSDPTGDRSSPDSRWPTSSASSVT